MVGQQPWDIEIGSNNKNIALEFSKHNRVLYVNSPLDRKTVLKHKSSPKIQKRIDVVDKKQDALKQVEPNLWIYYPDEIIESINWITNSLIYSRLNKINNKRFARSIKKAIEQLGFENYILFNDNDIFRSFYLKELLKPKISIYYSRDFMLAVDYWKQHGEKMEPELIAKSDICVANSVYLANYCKQYNPNSFYVGQGCDIDEFTHFKGEIPADVAAIKGPIIGYVGALQHIRLDIELLKYIALKNPEYSFVLVGPEDEEFKVSDLHQIENVHFLGSKPATLMPSYIKAFDVCLNPQIVNEVTIGNYPRKIDEYLAMGKPVIATQTEAMTVFADHVYLGKTFDDYVTFIKQALLEDSPQLQQQRISFAATHTWENSVKQIYKAIKLHNSSLQTTLGDKPIVIFSNMRFNSPIEATSLFIARSLAKTNLVYYIGYPYTVRDYMRNKDAEEFLTMRKSFFNAKYALVDTDTPNFKHLYLPIVASINFIPEGKIFRQLLKRNERAIIKRIKEVLKMQGVKEFIFINSFNFYYPGVGRRLKPALNIYQCIDPLITPYDLKHGFVSEKQLVEKSDMVICTSKALYNEKIKLNKHTYMVPNAADLTHSSKAADEKLPVHPKLKDIPKPIIGYFGSIERRIDYDLVKQVAQDNPNKSFVFAGPVYREHLPEWIFNAPNIYLPGPFPYDQMPQMLKGFDICIIPFKKDEVSATIFPLKLFEYLGAGKPVIITDFNTDLKDYTYGTVEFCPDADCFTDAINDILANDTAEKRTERLAVAQKNTWDLRSKQIIELIDEGLKDKNSDKI